MSSRHYRFFLARQAEPAGDDASTLVLKCKEDSAAVEKAKELLSTLNFQTAVVWDGDRKVSVVERDSPDIGQSNLGSY